MNERKLQKRSDLLLLGLGDKEKQICNAAVPFEPRD
jgi:hypothetical protein